MALSQWLDGENCLCMLFAYGETPFCSNTCFVNFRLEKTSFGRSIFYIDIVLNELKTMRPTPFARHLIFEWLNSF